MPPRCKAAEKKNSALPPVLRALRAKAACASLYEVCEEAYARTKTGPPLPRAMENGPQRRENLRRLCRLTRPSADCPRAAPRRLPPRRGRCRAAGGRRRTDGTGRCGRGGVRPPPSTARKGWNFPLWCWPSASGALISATATRAVLLHPALGLGLRLRAGEGGLYETAPHAAVRLAGLREAVDEEMRI